MTVTATTCPAAVSGFAITSMTAKALLLQKQGASGLPEIEVTGVTITLDFTEALEALEKLHEDADQMVSDTLSNEFTFRETCVNHMAWATLELDSYDEAAIAKGKQTLQAILDKVHTQLLRKSKKRR